MLRILLALLLCSTGILVAQEPKPDPLMREFAIAPADLFPVMGRVIASGKDWKVTHTDKDLCLVAFAGEWIDHATVTCEATNAGTSIVRVKAKFPGSMRQGSREKGLAKEVLEALTKAVPAR